MGEKSRAGFKFVVEQTRFAKDGHRAIAKGSRSKGYALPSSLSESTEKRDRTRNVVASRRFFTKARTTVFAVVFF